MPDLATRIAENVREVRGRIADAAQRSGRTASDITLVAVTKYVPVETIRPLVEAGCHDLGESRPQQLWDRAAALDDLPVRWHMIGHLQRNKVRRTLPLTALFHSVDSLRLLAALEEEAARLQEETKASSTAHWPVPVLLEVNVSGEEAKHGFRPDGMEATVAELPKFRNIAVRGLMCMAGLEGNLDDARREFVMLRTLREELRHHCPTGVSLDELSMGMSGDFEVAIEEGATIVRVGSALFEGVAC